MSTALEELLRGIRSIHGEENAFLPLHAPRFTGNEQAYVVDTIVSTFVSSVGAYVTRFEEMLCAATGAKYAIACVNGTAALQVALHVCGVRPGELVITQALSFVATANAIAHTGARPVFCDVDADTLGLAPSAVAAFLTEACERVDGEVRHKASGKRVAACVPMHTFGFPCRIEDLATLCEQWNIPLLEDAAEALGSRCGDRHCGTFGRIGTLSFNGNKIVTTGGGGALLTNDAELARLIKHLTTTAKLPHAWEFRHDALAWNFRMPNLNAALGCAQLERLDAFLRDKRAMVREYANLFAGSDYAFLQERAGTTANYWLFAVLCADRAERDSFLQQSNARGVMTRPCWEPLHTLPMYADCLRDALTATHDIAERLVNVPSSVRGA